MEPNVEIDAGDEEDTEEIEDADEEVRSIMFDDLARVAECAANAFAHVCNS